MPDGKLDNDPIFTLDTSALWAVYFFVILGTLTLPALGWQNFFLLTTLTGFPAVLLLVVVRDRVRALDQDPAAQAG